MPIIQQEELMECYSIGVRVIRVMFSELLIKRKEIEK